MNTQQLLDRLIKVKTRLLVVVFTVITFLFLPLNFVSWDNSFGGSLSFLSQFPFLDFFFGFLQIVIVIFIVDAFLRREADQRLQSMLFSKEVVRQSLTDDKVSELLDACFWRIVKDEEFAQDLVGIVKNGAVLPRRRMYNSRIDYTLFELDSNKHKPEVVRDFFGTTLDITFTETVQRRTFDFVSASTNDQYNELRNDSNVEWRWLRTKHPLIADSDPLLFSVTRFSADGIEVPPRPTKEQGLTRFLLPDNLMNKRVEIRYTLSVICKKRSHLIFYNFDYPTKGYEISLDYGNTDISFVSVVDGLSSPTSPKVTYFPDATNPATARRVTIRSNGSWVIPKSNVAFVWRLKDEEVGQ